MSAGVALASDVGSQRATERTTPATDISSSTPTVSPAVPSGLRVTEAASAVTATANPRNTAAYAVPASMSPTGGPPSSTAVSYQAAATPAAKPAIAATALTAYATATTEPAP